MPKKKSGSSESGEVTIGLGIADSISDMFDSTMRTQQKIIDNEAIRAQERAEIDRVRLKQVETTDRRRLDTARDIVVTKQKEFTKRHRSVAETVQTWRNTSDEILHAVDRPFFERKWYKGNSNYRLSVSPLDLMMFGYPIMAYGIEHSNTIIQDTGNGWASLMKDIVNNSMDTLQRTANAGNLSFDINNAPEPDGQDKTNIEDTSGDNLWTMQGSQNEESEHVQHVTPLRVLQSSLLDLGQQLKDIDIERSRTLREATAPSSDMGVILSPSEKKMLEDLDAKFDKLLLEYRALKNEIKNMGG